MRLKKEFLLVLSTILLVYLAISFINLKIDFTAWSQHARVAFICISFIASFFVIMVINTYDL